MSPLVKYLDRKYAPRWLILQIDLLITIFSVFLAFLLRFNFNLQNPRFEDFPLVILGYLTIRLIFFRTFRTYSGIIRYTSVEDAKRIFYAIAASNLAIMGVNVILYIFNLDFFVPISIFLIELLATLLIMTSFRILIKIIYHQFQKPTSGRENVVIYGGGKFGLITKRTIDQDGMVDYKIIGFLDDDIDKRGKSIEGVTIYNFERDFLKMIDKYSHFLLILAIQEISASRKKEIIEICLKYDIPVKTVPPANKWINGELSINQIKNVNIEELLERDPIRLDKSTISRQVNGKTIMVTGASGSIGSEVVRQLINFSPGKIILFDQAESPLNDLKLELLEEFDFNDFECTIGSVRDEGKVENVISRFRPHIVYHCAAYKHVPMMEESPSEAILTNVWGTKIVADISVKYGVEKFVMISTDKAVNPTNVMGASKRIAEIYTQSFNGFLSSSKTNGRPQTMFITTRFGNVLGSNGSVIPRFKKQIDEGGPVTVTHPEISRYFMTIPEACQLILEAGAIGKGGEIFIFDMGKSIKIVDLAKKMIKLSGFIPGKDIEIKFSGLRPGEKLREELLNNKENTLPTHHEKIMIASVRNYCFEEVVDDIENLIYLSNEGEDQTIVAKMKEIVPEFISQNSVYQSLDKMVH